MDWCKYKTYLEEFDYPNINGFSDEQIVGIFSSENRFFLLTWLAKNLNSQFIPPLELSKATEVVFANFFHESGFCTSSQKLPFVRGDNTLNNQEQGKIFDRIFSFLQILSQKENIEPIQNATDILDLESFLKMDINIFPTLGPLKLYTHKTRLQKINQCKQEIENLKQEIGNYMCENKEEDLDFEHTGYNEEEVDKNVDKFKKQAMKLQEISSVIAKINENDAGKKPGFKPDFENHLMNCNSEITTILQYFQNVNLTESVNKSKLLEQKGFEQNELSSILKLYVQSSSDIVKIIKNMGDQ